MLGYIIQRLIQAGFVMLAMSALVFLGVYAIGNPIDVLISPDATQDIREATSNTSRFWEGCCRAIWGGASC
jgi:peptide/nickel transport system permease protein